MTFNVSIIGATGLVGSTLLNLLEERSFPINNLHLVASKQSIGKRINFAGTEYIIQDIENFDFKQSHLCFFCVSKELAALYAPSAVQAGNVVIDKSNYYRNHHDVPLVIPEINPEVLTTNHRKMGIIASPNCNTIPIAMGLKPIYDAVGITRVNIATYQSVSGTGKDAMTELTEQSKQFLNYQPIQSKIYNQQIAFNVLPHCDDFQENGYTQEEMKMVREIQKIFNDNTLLVNPTAVRVPVFLGHAAAVHIETKTKINVEAANHLLSNAQGVKLITGKYPYATPLHDAAGNDFVYVGRVREDISHEKGLNLWIVADNLRKGAALNAIQIAEYLIKNNWLTT